MRNTRTDRRSRLGLVVNPIAGMGGKVGLKGTDGPEMLGEALRRGAAPIASMRARQALARIAIQLKDVEVLSGSGDLGESVARDLGIEPVLVPCTRHLQTTAEDTRGAAAHMLGAGVDLILFAGGDGTARDVFDAVGNKAPILGVPTGVKMHSAVFATTPEKAGDVAVRFLADRAPPERLRDAEIVDIDESQLQTGRLMRLHGYARVPYERLQIQHAKAGIARNDEAALDALCRQIAGTLQPGCLYLFGPGTTTQKVLRFAGIDGTLLGVDAVCDGKLVGVDLTERTILSLSERRPIRIVVSVIGGQGFLFGRGNQQISAETIKRAGRDGLIVVSSLEKILALDGHCLFVDTGDAALNTSLSGYMRVETAPDLSIVCKVVS